MTSRTTIFRNGLIFTGKESASSPTKSGMVVAIKGDRIVHVGSEMDTESKKFFDEKDARVVDLKGRSLLPGLIDR